eukprot:752136-Hanusia_phi.AAC.1
MIPESPGGEKGDSCWSRGGVGHPDNCPAGPQVTHRGICRKSLGWPLRLGQVQGQVGVPDSVPGTAVPGRVG